MAQTTVRAPSGKSTNGSRPRSGQAVNPPFLKGGRAVTFCLDLACVSGITLTGFRTLSGLYRIWRLYTKEPCYQKGKLWRT